MMDSGGPDVSARPTIEVVRVPSFERAHFRPLDGVQLRATYSHVRIGTYCPEPEPKPEPLIVKKPPIEQPRRYKKNLGPVSRLLRRRQNSASLATKSCDNIYSVHKSNSSLDWKHSQAHNDQAVRNRKSNSLDWRSGHTINPHLENQKGSRSAEQLSRSGNLHTPSAKSKIVSLLKRLSPRLPRPGSKQSFHSSPSICPWVQVEYKDSEISENVHLPSDSQEMDLSYQREMQLNEIRKMALKIANSPQKTVIQEINGVTAETTSPLRSNALEIRKLRDSHCYSDTHDDQQQSAEERRRQSLLRQEVADLEDSGPLVPGGPAVLGTCPASSPPLQSASILRIHINQNVSCSPTKRCSRPLSLAVQPLNYQRLDPDRQDQSAANGDLVNNNENLASKYQNGHVPKSALVNDNNNCNNKVLNGNNDVLDNCNQQQQQQQQQQQIVGKRKQRISRIRTNMTSQDSIGSCSLDVDKSISSERSELTLGSLSEKTLHSLNLSCAPVADHHQQQSSSTSVVVPILVTGPPTTAADTESISNGHHQSPEPDQQHQDAESPEQLTAKKPSYLGLACSISGYSGITRYDSKLREGFRSRDSSPAARLIAGDASAVRTGKSATLVHQNNNNNNNIVNHNNNPSHTLQSQSTMEHHHHHPQPGRHHHNGSIANGAITNGGVVRTNCKIDSYLASTTTSSSTSAKTQHRSTTESTFTTRHHQDYNSDQVDRGLASFHHHQSGFQDELSPVRTSSPKKLSPSSAQTRLVHYNQYNNSFTSTVTSSTRPPSANANVVNVSHTSFNESGVLNGSSADEESSLSLNTSSNSEKSFIQQRVERLYGPGALAQGFFRRSSGGSNKFNLSDSNKSMNGSKDLSSDENKVISDSDDSFKSLPVLRHLRPEFRAQLPVVSPRRPTDGSEQVIVKPLKRISLNAGKNVTKETEPREIIHEIQTIVESKMSSSITSLSDQQPAAPQVVLPVPEPSASSTNIAKQVAESSEKTEEKDGHYFIGLLNKERERLLSLAESAENELGENLATLPEEAAGKLRSGAGKARLLATQKMKQFEGLCHKNINQIPGEEFPTTSEDLAGFWDMVMLQVVQVNDLFDQIDQSRKLQWQEVSEPKSIPSTPSNIPKRRISTASKSKSTTNSEAARKAKEAREAREETRRQLIEERRRAMRSNTNKSQNSVEIFVPET